MLQDTDNDDKANGPLVNVTMTLYSETGDVVASTTTQSDGTFVFTNVPAGNYTVVETNPHNYQDVYEVDGTNDNRVAVTVTLAEDVTGVDFLDEPLRTISGDVFEDTDSDDIGNEPIVGAVVQLLDHDKILLFEVLTDDNGSFLFEGLPPGGYYVREVNPSGYISVVDSDSGDPDEIFVDASRGDGLMLRFVDELPSVSPTVSSIPSSAPSASPSLSSAPSLTPSKEPSSSVVPTSRPSKTPSLSMAPSKSPSDQPSLSAKPSASPSSSPSVSALPSATLMGSISGSVLEDTTNDDPFSFGLASDIGDSPLENVVVQLFDTATGTKIAETTTDANGNYSFTDIPKGSYSVVEINPDGYVDVIESDGVNDNNITVRLDPGENKSSLYFVDERLLVVSGYVWEDTNNDDKGDQPVPRVTVELYDADGLVGSIQTDRTGAYQFENMRPGTYTVQKPTNPPGFVSVSDKDGGDPDEILVVLTNRDKYHNDFVVELTSVMPSVSTVPSIHPTPRPTGRPTGRPTPRPTTPTRQGTPSGFGLDSIDVCPNDLIRPKRYHDYCPATESFLDLVKARRDTYTADPVGVMEDGYWYNIIEDKLAAKIFAKEDGIATPELLYCSDDIADIDTWSLPTGGNTGIVIKATGLHSGNGVFVLPNGFDQVELLSGVSMSRTDIKTALDRLGVTKYIIEKYVAGPNDTPIPDEYKIHMFNGEVGSIIYTTNRGSSCECFAELDADWNRVDMNGCFRSAGEEKKDSSGQCTQIDFANGQLLTMKGLDFCSSTPDKPSNLDDIIATAKAVSERIGVYMRIDMLVGADGTAMVGEFTPGHTNGRVHCSAKVDANGCVDSCFLGRLWSDTSSGPGLLHGGDGTVVPVGLRDWDTDKWQQTCDAFLAQL